MLNQQRSLAQEHCNKKLFSENIFTEQLYLFIVKGYRLFFGGLGLERSSYFDNARALLIIFVVIGHMIAGFVGKNDFISSLYMYIFIFHMPAFSLISGFFAKKIYAEGYLPKLVKKLLLPYAIFQFLYSAYYYFIFGDNVTFGMFVPRWALWFLVSLFLWNVLLYFFGKMKYGVIVAVIVSLLVGYDQDVGELLSLSRTLFFFPFFLVGYHLKKEHFERLTTKKHVIIGVVSAIVIFVTFYYTVPIEYRAWLIGKRSYYIISDYPIEWSWLGRLVTYIVTGFATYVFLTLVPKKKTFFTSIGSITISVYLMHMAFIRWFMDSPLKKYVIESNQYWLLFVISLIIVYVLSRKWVVRLTNTIALQENVFRKSK